MRVGLQVIHVGSTCPEIVPWVASMYGTHSSLFYQSRIIQSQSGVQQGDPLGPLLFAWALHPTASLVSSTVPWCSWYLDDGALIGTRVQLETALAALQSETRRTGLRLNLSKCQVWGPATPYSLPLLDCFTQSPLSRDRSLHCFAPCFATIPIGSMPLTW